MTDYCIQSVKYVLTTVWLNSINVIDAILSEVNLQYIGGLCQNNLFF